MEVKDDKQESERLDMRDEQSTLFEAPGSRSPSLWEQGAGIDKR